MTNSTLPTLPTPTLYDQLEAAKTAVQTHIGEMTPTVGLILGSGLSSYANSLTEATTIAYADIPHFPLSTVSGHAGQLVIGNRSKIRCAAMAGRTHYYEGHSATRIAFGARLLVHLGCKTLIITNAAGGLRHPAGTLMRIRDHLNLIGDNPLRGPNDERLGPRFPDMSCAYDRGLGTLAHSVAAKLDIDLQEGVYAALAGPSYETPAEINMLDVLGADAVGMSTVPEVIVANHMGARVLGISCITNQAAGLGETPLSHDDVKQTAAQIHGTFKALLDGILAELFKHE